jgi:hypothetical protein
VAAAYLAFLRYAKAKPGVAFLRKDAIARADPARSETI